MTHFDWGSILEIPADKDEDGGRAAVVRLEKGDTAYLPGTSKWVAQCTSASAQLTYYIHPVTSSLVDVIGDITQIRPA
ncbi:hypothetical protein HOT75_gp155 [Gordonia phage Daredevil]|uniref:Uncharacterized protein n=1 Tax=Gordonia phage Daredevil TaxID=2283286 RepID=A0A345MJ10_9CAUD|nr:hypothetical protein HOT75_gp155 [Gordonia phage Daredevil]AXH70541.1 hypothetical protein SEA_DAREDEVIL_155 [Gordonia phage Daredevil]